MIDKNCLFRKQTNKHYKNIETLEAKDEAWMPPVQLISTRIGTRNGESFREFALNQYVISITSHKLYSLYLNSRIYFSFRSEDIGSAVTSIMFMSMMSSEQEVETVFIPPTMDFEHFRAEHTLDCDSSAIEAILNTFCTGIMMKITAKDKYILETAPILICGFVENEAKFSVTYLIRKWASITERDRMCPPPVPAAVLDEARWVYNL